VLSYLLKCSVILIILSFLRFRQSFSRARGAGGGFVRAGGGPGGGCVCVSVLLKVCVCVSFIKKSGLSCRLLSVAYVPLFFTFTDIVFSYFFGSSIHIRFWSSRVLMN
jgi:hypothetical protein